jgi:hypothetical protein
MGMPDNEVRAGKFDHPGMEVICIHREKKFCDRITTALTTVFTMRKPTNGGNLILRFTCLKHRLILSG